MPWICLARSFSHSAVRRLVSKVGSICSAPSAFLRCLHDTHLESANVAVDGLPVDGVPFRRFA